jgi:hypothetical protein
MTKPRKDGGKTAEGLLAAIWEEIERLDEVAIRAAPTAQAARARAAAISKYAMRIGALSAALRVVIEPTVQARSRRK